MAETDDTSLLSVVVFTIFTVEELSTSMSISTLFTPESSLFSFLFLMLNPFLFYLYFVECFTRSFVPIVSRGRAKRNQPPSMCLSFTLPVDFSVYKNTGIVEIIWRGDNLRHLFIYSQHREISVHRFCSLRGQDVTRKYLSGKFSRNSQVSPIPLKWP